jgi:hypothetical protein
MSDEREKVIHTKNEEPDVEAHKVLKGANDEKATEDDAETPDVEAHKFLSTVQHKVQH